MYSMQPLVDRYWDVHYGFYCVAIICAFFTYVMCVLWREREIPDIGFGISVAILFTFVLLSHAHSYQPEVKYANVRVIGDFVGYQPEGYNEQSGKTRADHHYMYVVYKIEGRMVIFRTEPGQSWPDRAVFYRNSIDKLPN